MFLSNSSVFKFKHLSAVKNNVFKQCLFVSFSTTQSLPLKIYVRTDEKLKPKIQLSDE